MQSSRFGLVRRMAGVFLCAIFSVVAYAGTTAPSTVPAVVHMATDRGPVSGEMPLSLRLNYAPSTAQNMALQQLLSDQRTHGSAEYHKWITPDEFAAQFGISSSDEARVRGWLVQEGFSNITLSQSRTAFSFSATAAQAQTAFHTQVHALTVGGESHYSNVTEISIPATLSSVVRSVRGLNDFKPHAIHKPRAQFSFGSGGLAYELAPGDIATIYDTQSLYGAGINGSGVTVAVVGQSDIALSDIADYRAGFQLPAIAPSVVLVPGSSDPGFGTTDQEEADLDLELLGAVAPNANLIYVNSTNVDTSLEYTIQQNLAQVVSMSFAACEAIDTLSDQQSMAFLIDEANSQGMTIVAGSGDTGAAGCDSTTETAAQDGLSVESPANLPGVTGVGGTSFIGPLTPFFAASNGTTGGSALSYIPEQAWNLTASQGHLEASGGGASVFFAKPGWQEGAGVPTDGQRDVPDVAMFAGDGALDDSTAYVICAEGDCASGAPNLTTSGGAAGGTSAATPVFAGIVALLNNYLVSNNIISAPGLGNINPTLYLMAGNTTNVFHSITQGNNIVPCALGTTNCTTGSFGYSAGPGYNQVTGLGSVDGFNLVHAWDSFTVTGTNTALTTSETNIVFGTPIALTAKVLPSSGSGIATGTMTFYTNAGQINTLTEIGTVQLDGTGTATLSLPNGLAEDVSSIQAAYGGSSQYAQSLSAQVNVFQPTTTVVTPSATQIVQGAPITLTALVSGVNANTAASVNFFIGTTEIGSATLTNGTAALTINTLPLGTDSITATFPGSTFFASSTSPAISVAVSVLPVSTTTSLSVSAAQASQGTPITLTAAVVAASGAPTGTVNFFNGSTQIGSAMLTNGTATLSISTLAVGSNFLTATYPGVSGFESSTSAAASVTILQPSFTLAATPSTLSVTGGVAATTALTVTPTNGFNSALSFSCSGLPAGSSCTFGTPVSQSNGTSTVALSISTETLSASAMLGFLPLLGLIAVSKRRKMFQLCLAPLALLVIAIATTGCGGGTTQTPAPQAPAPVTSTITVSALSASGETQTTQITLTVN